MRVFDPKYPKYTPYQKLNFVGLFNVILNLLIKIIKNRPMIHIWIFITTTFSRM